MPDHCPHPGLEVQGCHSVRVHQEGVCGGNGRARVRERERRRKGTRGKENSVSTEVSAIFNVICRKRSWLLGFESVKGDIYIIFISHLIEQMFYE